MLRAVLIILSQTNWVKELISHWKFAWKTASRFVAGEELPDAIRAIKRLNNEGIFATVDHLGEHTSNVDFAKKATQDILKIIDTIDRSDVKANVSIKLTQIGLNIDEDLCADNLLEIVDFANQKHNFVRIDMEDSTCLEATLKLFHRMYTQNRTNVGLVIQAYLYRSEQDIRAIIENGGKIRLCKGAYKESSKIAFPKKRDVDANFDRLTEIMLDHVNIQNDCLAQDNGRFPPLPAIATHDPLRIEHAKRFAKINDIPKQALEFQMLYGIRRDLQAQLVEEGYPVRVYVPYGIEWYPYFMRRLAERPANLWFFLSNFFRD